MLLAEAETLGILTRRRLLRKRLPRGVRKHGVPDRLTEISDRVRSDVLSPFLAPESHVTVKEAAQKLRSLRIEANWLVFKSHGLGALLKRSLTDLADLRKALGGRRYKAARWAQDATGWLDRIQAEHEGLRGLVPIVDAYRDYFSRIPLEWLERWFPKKLFSADVEALALNCLGAVVDGEVASFDERRLTLVLRAARKLESDYSRFLKWYTKLVHDIARAPEEFAGVVVSEDPATVTVAIAIGVARQEMRWLPALAKLSKETLGATGPVTLKAAEDPEEPGRITLRLHVGTALEPSAVLEGESRFWAEVEKLGPELFDILTLSYRPATNGSAGLP